jgi:hypothetical protein
VLRLHPRPPRRVGFFPGDSADGLRRLPGTDRLEVVLSNHLVRYALLPWSPALTTDDEWMAYARHVFDSTYGADAAGWRIRVCDGGRGKARVACATDAALLDAIAAVERVASIQPHLMAAFNARRGEFGADPGWFVLHEPGRLTLGLVAGGEWKCLRNRQATEDWRNSLPDLLQRETAASGVALCARVVLGSGVAAGLTS